MPLGRVPTTPAIDRSAAPVRRVRAPLRHSVTNASSVTTASSLSGRDCRNNSDGAATDRNCTGPRRRSSYADPTIANSADPYIKMTSQWRTGYGGISSITSSSCATNVEPIQVVFCVAHCFVIVAFRRIAPIRTTILHC